MKSMIVPILAVFTVFSACANRPESIHASYVSHEKFMHLNCTELDSAMTETRAELENYCKQQNSKANSDAVGVFLLGVPFSKLSGDFEGEIARLKGQVEAIETAQIKNGCNATTSSQPATPAAQ